MAKHKQPEPELDTNHQIYAAITQDNMSVAEVAEAYNVDPQVVFDIVDEINRARSE